MWKKKLVLSLLFVFGIMSLSCIAGEDERNPLLGTPNTQQPRPINSQYSEHFDPRIQQWGPYQHQQQPTGGWPTPQVDEGEMLYQQGMQFLAEAQRLRAMNDSIEAFGDRVGAGGRSGNPVTWRAYNSAHSSAFSYFKEASSKGHVGAMIRIKEANFEQELLDNQNITFCCNEGSEKTFSTTCCVISACCPILCPVWLVARTVMLINTTTDEEVVETHKWFDKEMNDLCALESRTQHPIFKHDISQLKNNLSTARARYDHRVSLRFNQKRCYMSCCNCEIRETNSNHTVQ
jgi:hypothetical protein